MEVETNKAKSIRRLQKQKKNKRIATKRHKETPKELAPQKKRTKKNSPKKDLDDSELKLMTKNKILTQSTKVTLIKDFFDTLGKSSSIKLVPDPT